MNIKIIEDALIKYDQLSLRQISVIADEDQGEVELLLKEWVTQKKVSRGEKGSDCSDGCDCPDEKIDTCGAAPEMVYRWRG